MAVNIQQLPAQEAVAAALVARRREYAAALRACKPAERIFLRQLPKSRYSPYVAGRELQISDSTVWKMVNRPRVKRAMELFLRDALDDLGVSHSSLIADLQHIKDLCLKHLVTDPKAAAGAISAVRELIELKGLAAPKRIEHTGLNGQPLMPPIFNISFEDGAPGEYGVESSHDTPGSGESTH